MPALRINKFLAERLGVSRRVADELIAQGQILVNGQPASIGVKVDKDDIVCYNEEIVPYAVDFTYLVLNKPVGYVCSRRRQGQAQTIYRLLPNSAQKLKAVGRLDKDSSGLILLTDDGDFAFRMTHPKFKKKKVYRVALDRPLAQEDEQKISCVGVELTDGQSKLGLKILDKKRLNWEVTMYEGRNRQIRRTFGALGYTVMTLHRLQFGPYHLDDLADGQIKRVSNSN